MTWTWAQALAAATRLQETSYYREALATVRPRGVAGLVRTRAPLPLLLYVAARDGLIVEQDNGGFAVLQRPATDKPMRTGGHVLGLLRRLDRNWDFAQMWGPPVLFLLLALGLVPSRDLWLVALFLPVAAALWVCVFLAGMMAFQIRWVARMGSRSSPDGEGGRAAQSLPAYHWSIPLLHQPDPARADDLLRLLSKRLTNLVWSDLRASARQRARVQAPDVTETLVVLTGGITTHSTREAVSKSLRAIGGYPQDSGVVVLESPGRLEQVPRRPRVNGGFLLLYLFAVAVSVAVCAVAVASIEADECEPGPCDGRPATYQSAVRFLLQRLFFTDPPGLAPATVYATVLGYLFSVVSAVGILVAVTAGKHEVRRNLEVKAEHEEMLEMVTGRARVLLLVAADVERDAVLRTVRDHTGRQPVLDYEGDRVIYGLGPLAGNEIVLAQAGEQGESTIAGMMATAETMIRRCRPDHVILVGICYGLRPDEAQRLGDVVVARRVQNIDHRKVTERDGTPFVIDRGVNVGCSPGLLDRFQAGQATWSRSPVRIHIGTVLTSQRLVDSRTLVKQLREEYPDAIAGEMEGVAVHEAASIGLKPNWIMIKGISDWGFHKTDEDQELAARNAAEFVAHVIAGGGLGPRWAADR